LRLVEGICKAGVLIVSAFEFGCQLHFFFSIREISYQIGGKYGFFATFFIVLFKFLSSLQKKAMF